MRRLQSLNVGWCANVDDDDVAWLRDLTLLTDLQLARTKASLYLSCLLLHVLNSKTLDTAHAEARRLGATTFLLGCRLLHAGPETAGPETA